MSPKTFKRLRRLALYALPLVALYLAYLSNRNEYYRNKIPPEIRVGSVVEIGSTFGGFRGGCGAAIFEITHDARTESREPAHVSTNGEPRMPGSSRYPGWQETPYVETGDGFTLEDRWIGGLSCADPKSATMRTIGNALSMSGSYYQKRGLAGVIVVPSAGIVAYVYFE